MNNTKYLWTAVIVVAIIAVLGVFTPAGQKVAGLVGSVGTTSNTNYTGVFRNK